MSFLYYVFVEYRQFSFYLTDITILSDNLASVLRSLPIGDFTYVVEIVTEALSHARTASSDELISLVRLSSLLVHDAPEGESYSKTEHVT